AKLSEAENRAIKLLTPPKPNPIPVSHELSHSAPVVPAPAAPRRGLKQVDSGTRSRLSHHESLSEAQELVQKLRQNEKLRLTIHWTLEEEEG
ncbi:MAG: hypothetical protein MUD03_16455, partial [Pirellula sp.]|nr:hypothetical protein [Pirellula sp.]